MSRIAYVDGRYVLHRHASVHIEDRGFQFADGIYEVVAVIGGRRFDEPRHLDRLERLELISRADGVIRPRFDVMEQFKR